MSPKTISQPAKRARTSGSTAGSVKGPQDVAEEWAQVNDLVERRRLQNRLSQKNYRNKIRARLEKLESLLDANPSGQAQAPEEQCIKEVATILPKPDSTKLKARTEQPDLSSTTEPADVWNPMSEFLNFSTDASFENYAHNSRLPHDSDGKTGNEYPSPDPSFDCPTSPSFSVAEAMDFCAAPTSPPSDPISRSPPEIENINPRFSPGLDQQPTTTSPTPDLSSYPLFSGYAEPHSTTSASSPFFPGMPPLPSYFAAGTSPGCESTTVNPIDVFPAPPYQPPTTATPYASHQQPQQQLQYVWIPFLVPMLTSVTPPPQSGLHGIHRATVSAGRQRNKS